MPSPKRWFPVSHELLHDPELRTFLQQCGERSLRTWLYILSGTDRSGNRFRMPEETLPSICRVLDQKPRRVCAALAQLVRMGWIEALEVSASGWPTLVSVPKYTKYHRSREPHKSPAGDRQAPSEPIRTYPNLIKNKSKSADPLYPPELKTTNGHSDGPMILPPGFEEFWKAYPKKKGKDAALEMWKKKAHKPPLPEILDAITKAKETKEWKKDGGEFIPYPATWLHNGCWADEPTEPPKPQPPRLVL